MPCNHKKLQLHGANLLDLESQAEQSLLSTRWQEIPASAGLVQLTVQGVDVGSNDPIDRPRGEVHHRPYGNLNLFSLYADR